MARAARKPIPTIPAVPRGPVQILATEVLEDLRAEHRQAEEDYAKNRQRILDDLANPAFDVARSSAWMERACEAQQQAGVLWRAVKAVKEGRDQEVAQPFADRLRDLLDQVGYELKSTLRNRPWESSSTCQITNVLDRAKLGGKVKAWMYLESRLIRWLDPARVALVDDIAFAAIPVAHEAPGGADPAPATDPADEPA